MPDKDDAEKKEQLKETIRKVVVGQGNRFIKELLRENNIAIGTTKADFLDNIMSAVDEGSITINLIESWLAEIEGWGNQHIYLFEPLEVSSRDISSLVKASRFSDLFNLPATHAFPDELELTSIALRDNTLSLTWHRGNDRWTRVQSKDFRQDEEGDLFEYRAFRQRSNRTVVRFEWQFNKPYSTVLLQLPHEGSVHADCLQKVWEVILDIGLVLAPPAKIALTNSVNGFSVDTANITASGRTMRAEGGRVDFISTTPEIGIADIEALRTVNSAVDPLLFLSADGRFRLDNEAHTALSRVIHVDIYGSQSRVRIGVQCKREDVYYMTDLVWEKSRQ